MGIRHAIKTGTILIREHVDFTIPFDISHLRHIEYTQEPAGMERLANQLKRMFDFYERNPTKPDNQFLELCSFTNYIPTIFGKDDSAEKESIANLFTMILTNPRMLGALTDNSLSSEQQQKAFFEELLKSPAEAKQLVQELVKAGVIEF